MTTFAEKAFEALKAFRASHGGAVTRAEWIKVVDDLVATEGVFRKKRPSSRAPKVGKPRNPLFDALAVVHGVRDLSKLTRNGARCVGVALADILEVSPDLTVAEIERCAALYRQRHPTWPLTAPALAKNWAEFARSASTRSSKTDVYVEPSVEWRSVGARLYPDSKEWINPHDFASIKWFDLDASLRRAILAKLFPS